MRYNLNDLDSDLQDRLVPKSLSLGIKPNFISCIEEMGFYRSLEKESVYKWSSRIVDLEVTIDVEKDNVFKFEFIYLDDAMNRTGFYNYKDCSTYEGRQLQQKLIYETVKKYIDTSDF